MYTMMFVPGNVDSLSCYILHATMTWWTGCYHTYRMFYLNVVFFISCFLAGRSGEYDNDVNGTDQLSVKKK